MRTSWRRSALALVLAGCAGPLGLAETRVDTDRDGIDDADDNCPTVFNPDQADRDGVAPGDACDVCPAERSTHRDLDGDGVDDGCDQCIGPGPTGVDSDGDGLDDGCDPCIGGVSTYAVDDDHDGIADGCDACVGYIGVDIDRDGIDDACDRCLAGPPDDQDGDGLEDACDLCPGVADAGADASTGDGDTIGDACDPYPTTADVRALFDGFRVFDAASWNPDATGQWVIADDAATFHEAGSLVDLNNTTTLTVPYFAALRVTASGSNTAGAFLALDGRNTFVGCQVTGDGTLFLDDGTNFLSSTTPPTPAGPYTLVVSASRPQTTTTRITCDLRADGAYLTPTRAALSLDIPAIGTWHLALIPSDGARYDWIDLIQGRILL